MDQGLWDMFRKCGGFEQTILYLLLGCSLVMWALAFLKLHDLFVAKRNVQRFLLLFQGADSLDAARAAEFETGDSPHRSIYLAALSVLNGKFIPATRADVEESRKLTREELLLLNMQHTGQAYFSRLQWGLGFLATLGTTSPFIGLFGTVWGIMTTFKDLGEAKSPSMSVVAPGISSALIATAAGLAVAIPAVMFYNWFMAQIAALQSQADAFIERMDVLGRAKLKEQAPPPAAAPAPAGEASGVQAAGLRGGRLAGPGAGS